MNKKFLKLGSKFVSTDHIVAVDTETCRTNYPNPTRYTVMVYLVGGTDGTMCGADGAWGPFSFEFDQGTPEAERLLSWLESRYI